MQNAPTAMIALAAFLTMSAYADLDSDLADLSARTAYGFYTGEPAVIAAARIGLEQLPGRSAQVSYHRALGEFRSAELAARAGSPSKSVARCLDLAAEATEQDASWVEPWVLVAACSALGAQTESLKSPLHARRYDHAIERVRALDRGNPRLPLVTAWRRSFDPARLDAADVTHLTVELEAALKLFAQREAPDDAVEWGEPETLVLLGALYLDRGDLRSARDVIERALLVAPGYVDALTLQRRLVGGAPP